jgi:mitogen-activated protein kinase organizer 1
MPTSIDTLQCPSTPIAQLRGHADGPIHIIRFTSDGNYCLTGGNDRTVRLWNPTRVDPAYRPPLSNKLSSQEYYARQYSESYGGDESSMQLQQNLPSALPMQTYAEGHVHPVHAITTNSSSTVLLSSSDKTLIATNLVTAQTVQKWWGHTARIEFVTCLGGGGENNNNNNIGEEIYASASYDATVRLWDARSKSKEPLMILDDAKDSVSCVSSGGKGVAQIVTSSVDGKIRTYDLRIGQLITEDISHPITSFAVSNDCGSVAASCLDGIIRLFDKYNRFHRIDDRKKIFQKFHTLHISGNYKLECAFTSNDDYVISGSECGAVVVYPVRESLDGGRVLRRHKAPTCSVTSCPQSSRPWLIASASYDGSAVVWASQEEADLCMEQ